MNCPGCETPLISVFYEGVRVRVCGQCSGVLVGDPELKLIVQRREVEIPRAGGLASVQGSERKQACPACEAAMRKRRYRNTITVDQCPKCRAFWLDRGELEDLQLLAEMAADEKSASNRAESLEHRKDNRPFSPDCMFAGAVRIHEISNTRVASNANCLAMNRGRSGSRAVTGVFAREQ